MKLRKAKVFRDPVHDTISWKNEGELGRLVCTLIDTPEFQRLRHIRQLGMANLVFHGAEHSRFTHSIGVAHLARRMVDQLEDQYSGDVRAVTILLGLLHDIGHGPFSHVIERVFDFQHEDYSRAIILSEDTEIHQILRAWDSGAPGRIAARLKPGADSPQGTSIIASQLDADRFDYLLSDSLMTGVKVGRFDLERILLMLGEDDEGLWVDHRAWEAVEGYLLSRYHMYRLLYFHRTVRAAESMLQLAFERAKWLVERGYDELLPEGPLGRLMLGEDVPAEEYVRSGEFDAWLAFRRWSESDDEVLPLLARGLLERRLFQWVEVPAATEEELEEDRQKYQRVRSELSANERCLLTVDEAGHDPYQPYSPDERTSPIRVRDARGRIRFIDELSPVTRTLGEAGYRFRRWYYHPVIADKISRILEK
jgi:HD superfamily phosphohydrolase